VFTCCDCEVRYTELCALRGGGKKHYEGVPLCPPCNIKRISNGTGQHTQEVLAFYVSKSSNCPNYLCLIKCMTFSLVEVDDRLS
jgi:hypothetical protein